MRRRDFISLLGGAAVAWPRAARAQQAAKIRRIGFLSGTSRTAVSGLYDAFVQGMRELGYVEGKDFVIEWRSVEGNYERARDIAAEFVQLRVDVIVTGLAAALPTLQRDVTTIPIVMAQSADPVGNGFVASLAHPGGNITGLTSSSDDTAPKQLELLATIVPNMSRVGLLGNPGSTVYGPVRKSVEDAARNVSISVLAIEIRNPQDIEQGFAALVGERVPAVIGTGDAVLFGQRQRIAELALANRLATMFSQREYVAAGSLMSYGENLADFFRRSTVYVDKLFKGAKPGELPIEQPARFNLVINRKTADALGLAIPPQLYIFADEVLE